MYTEKISIKKTKMFKIKNKDPWKEKAVERQKEMKLLRKRIRELIKSRDIWRNKWEKERKEKNKLKEDKKK